MLIVSTTIHMMYGLCYIFYDIGQHNWITMFYFGSFLERWLSLSRLSELHYGSWFRLWPFMDWTLHLFIIFNKQALWAPMRCYDGIVLSATPHVNDCGWHECCGCHPYWRHQISYFLVLFEPTCTHLEQAWVAWLWGRQGPCSLECP